MAAIWLNVFFCDWGQDARYRPLVGRFIGAGRGMSAGVAAVFGLVLPVAILAALAYLFLGWSEERAAVERSREALVAKMRRAARINGPFERFAYVLLAATWLLVLVVILISSGPGVDLSQRDTITVLALAVVGSCPGGFYLLRKRRK